MNFNGFCEQVKDGLKQYFNEDEEIIIRKIKKNNGVELTGVSVKSTISNISPTLYIDEFYERARFDFDGVLAEIAEILKEHGINKRYDFDFYRNYELVKDNIVYRLVNKEKNRTLLEDVPHIDYLDMSLIFYYVLTEDGLGAELLGQRDGVSAGILIHNNHAELWGQEVNGLYKDAIINTPRLYPPTEDSMMDILKNILINKIQNNEEWSMEDKESQEEIIDAITRDSSVPMYVLSNEEKYFGASVILYEDLLDNVATKLKDDLYVLPSSIHEVIVIPASFASEKNSLSELVKEVNETKVPYGEILSDNVYYYILEEHCLSVWEQGKSSIIETNTLL